MYTYIYISQIPALYNVSKLGIETLDCSWISGFLANTISSTHTIHLSNDTFNNPNIYKIRLGWDYFWQKATNYYVPTQDE